MLADAKVGTVPTWRPRPLIGPSHAARIRSMLTRPRLNFLSRKPSS